MRKFISVLLVAIFILSFSFKTKADNAPGVIADAAVLIDENGELLYGKNYDSRMGMASTTKIMTAIVAIESFPLLDVVVTVPDKAVEVEGSSVYLTRGESITMETLLYALMLESGNDAAEAIAITIAGSCEKFAVLMNEKTAELGLQNTHFVNPHGLYNDDHYTSAYDLAKIAAYALKNETFRKIVSTKSMAAPMYDGSGYRYFKNHNKLLSQYKGCIGVKNGFTKATGRCLVSAAQRGGLTLICVTLRDPDDWRDHAALLDWGFNNFKNVKLAGPGEISRSIPVTGGVSENLTCQNTGELLACLPNSAGEVTSQVYVNNLYFAPIEKGDVLGYVKFYCDGKMIGFLPLTATESVDSVEKTGFFKKIWNFILSLGDLFE